METHALRFERRNGSFFPDKLRTNRSRNGALSSFKPIVGGGSIGGEDLGQALRRLPDAALDSWYTGCTEEGTLISNLSGMRVQPDIDVVVQLHTRTQLPHHCSHHLAGHTCVTR